jgi:hypothetical protein
VKRVFFPVNAILMFVLTMSAVISTNKRLLKNVYYAELFGEMRKLYGTIANIIPFLKKGGGRHTYLRMSILKLADMK